MAIDHEDRVHVAYTVGEVLHYAYRTSTTDWTDEVTLLADVPCLREMAVDVQGNVYIATQRYPSTRPTSPWMVRTPDGIWHPDTAPDGVSTISIAPDPTDGVHLLYGFYSSSADEEIRRARVHGIEPWEETASTGNLIDGSLAVAAGVGHAVIARKGGSLDYVSYAPSPGVGQSLGSGLVVLGRCGIAGDSSGGAHIVGRFTPSNADLLYTHFASDGVVTVEVLGHDDPDFTRQAVAVDAQDGVHFAYERPEGLAYEYRSGGVTTLEIVAAAPVGAGALSLDSAGVPTILYLDGGHLVLATRSE